AGPCSRVSSHPLQPGGRGLAGALGEKVELAHRECRIHRRDQPGVRCRLDETEAQLSALAGNVAPVAEAEQFGPSGPFTRTAGYGCGGALTHTFSAGTVESPAQPQTVRAGEEQTVHAAFEAKEGIGSRRSTRRERLSDLRRRRFRRIPHLSATTQPIDRGA